MKGTSDALNTGAAYAIGVSQDNLSLLSAVAICSVIAYNLVKIYLEFKRNKRDENREEIEREQDLDNQ